MHSSSAAWKHSRTPPSLLAKPSNLMSQWPGRVRTTEINEREIDGAKWNLNVGPSLFNLWHILTCRGPPAPPARKMSARPLRRPCWRGLMPGVAAQRQFIAKKASLHRCARFPVCSGITQCPCVTNKHHQLRQKTKKATNQLSTSYQSGPAAPPLKTPKEKTPTYTLTHPTNDCFIEGGADSLTVTVI